MQKGFTLIEIMIVVVILGILSTVAIPKFGKAYGVIKLSSALYTITSNVQNLKSLSIFYDYPFFIKFNLPNSYTIGYPREDIKEEFEEKLKSEDIWGDYKLPSSYIFSQITFYEPKEDFYYLLYNLPKSTDEEKYMFFFPNGTFYAGYIEISSEKYNYKGKIYLMGETGIVSSMKEIKAEKNNINNSQNEHFIIIGK